MVKVPTLVLRLSMQMVGTGALEVKVTLSIMPSRCSLLGLPADGLTCCLFRSSVRSGLFFRSLVHPTVSFMATRVSTIIAISSSKLGRYSDCLRGAAPAISIIVMLQKVVTTILTDRSNKSSSPAAP